MESTSEQVHVEQPAPAPIHAHTHRQQRLFLGPLPPASLSPERVNNARRRYWSLGSKGRSGDTDIAIGGARSRSGDGGLVDESTSPRRPHVSLPAILRPDTEPASVPEEFDLAISPTGPFFIIGQEFERSAGKQPAEGEHGDDEVKHPPVIFVNEAILKSDEKKHTENAHENIESASTSTAKPPPHPISRPSIYPRTTTDRFSYKTARSQLATSINQPVNAPPSSKLLSGSNSKPVDTPGTVATSKTGTTDFFSARSEILVDSDDEDKSLSRDRTNDEAMDLIQPELQTEYHTPLSASPSQLAIPTSPRFSTILRSALRKGSMRFKSSEEQANLEGNPDSDPRTKSWGKKRTVQFPAEHSDVSVSATAVSSPAVAHTTKPTSSSTSESDPKFPVTPDEPPPASPREVLARTGSSVAGTSAGIVEAAKRKKRPKGLDVDSRAQVEAADEADKAEEADPKRIILRDRMLVAVGRNSHPHLTGYNEKEARRKPSECVKAIEEYMVVYRKGWVELHKEWSTPIGRSFRKTKRLSFAIPLLSIVTSFSMFSRRDLSFALCLDNVTLREEIQKTEAQNGTSSPHTIRARSRRKRVVNRMKKTKEFQWIQDQNEKNRSLVFVFIGRERTRMLDWCWEIWKELGGQVPEQLRVHVPIFESVIDLPRPREDYTASPATLRAFSRSRILLDVFTALRNQLPDYDDFVKREMERSGGHSLRLELAWETGMHLDWIPSFAEWSVEDQEREWAVLAGLTLDEPHDPCELLLLPIRHDTNDLKLSNGIELREPPAVEGFLNRMSRAKGTQVKRRLFVHSQSGYLLATPTRYAAAPFPPYPHPVNDAKIREAYFADERGRNAQNMLHSDGLIDFRSIVRIEPPKTSSETAFKREGMEPQDDKQANAKLETTLQHLTASQFVVVLSSDEIVWLEASDEQVAIEWFKSLKNLCSYWSHRQRVDARDRMNLIKEMNLSAHTAGAADSELARDSLTCRIANWCPFERCNTVIHCGRLYLKNSPSSQFRETFCVLVPGFLVTYRVTAECYHKRENVYSLAETYIYSGYLAQAQLHKRLRVDNPLETRLYQDGLSSADGVEDCSFVLWIRRDQKVGSHAQPVSDSAAVESISSQGRSHIAPRVAKRPTRMIACRARCKLERDLWMRALSIETETHSRENKSQQEILRYGGKVDV